MGKVASKKRTKREIERLRKELQRLLDERKDEMGFALKVTDVTRQQEEWLTIIVVPDSPGVRAYEYAHALTLIEDEFEKRTGDRHILLLPTLPGDVM
jgi:hypothetical protein